MNPSANESVRTRIESAKSKIQVLCDIVCHFGLSFRERCPWSPVIASRFVCRSFRNSAKLAARLPSWPIASSRRTLLPLSRIAVVQGFESFYPTPGGFYVQASIESVEFKCPWSRSVILISWAIPVIPSGPVVVSFRKSREVGRAIALVCHLPLIAHQFASHPSPA